METKQKGNCVLCGYEYNDYGHSPQPLADKGRVCSKCEQKVIKARLQVINYKREEDKFEEPTFLRKNGYWKQNETATEKFYRLYNTDNEEEEEETRIERLARWSARTERRNREQEESERVSRERIERRIIGIQDENDREENELIF